MDNENSSYFLPASSDVFQEIAEIFDNPENASAKELLAWARLGILVLAIAGIMALLVATSRIPGIEKLSLWPIGFFQKGLVVHVIFSFIIWFLAIYGALLCLFIGRQAGGYFGRIIAGMAFAASAFMAIPAFMNKSVASLNNYVPTIINPVFYIGLGLLGAALLFQTFRYLNQKNLFNRTLNTFKSIISLAALLFAVSIICLIIAGFQLWGESPSEDFNENLFWGFGHILQFMNVAMLIGAWVYLANISGLSITPGPYRLAGALLLLASFAGPLIYGFSEPFSATQQLAFTNLQYAFAPVTAVVLFSLAAASNRLSRPYPWRNPAFLTLVLSMFVFCIGGILGLFVDGADTRTPAHYHGVIAGINLAFMGLYYTLFLPLLGRAIRITKIIYIQIAMFAGGQTLASIGLFMAGGYGVPRKVAGADQGLEAIGAYAGMFMNGIGALIAIIGGVLFIWSMATALFQKPTKHQN
jgi:cytochrome c oxidase subunit 1